MPAIELPDHRFKLFGRGKDIAFLRERAARTGLTAVFARPQMGKSWLLKETGRSLADASGGGWLIGYAEATESTPDLLLRSITDLYQRWLDNATLREQAAAVWEQQRGSLLPNFAAAIGRIVKDLPGVGKPLGGAINEALNGLVAANQTLLSGGMQLPPLQYEQARDLVQLVAQVSRRPIALILDQWEKSSNPSGATDPLYAFVHKAEEWPACHVFLGLRNEREALRPLRDLVASHAGRATLHELQEMDLTDPPEQRRMLAFLNMTVPATKRVDPAEIGEQVAGYPGVIYRWTSPELSQAMAEGDLERVANDAQNYRFRELEAQLKALDSQRLKLAVRIVLVPLASDPVAWPVVRSIVLDGIDEDLLDDLWAENFLTTVNPPSFDHSKKLEAARDVLSRTRAGTIRAQGMMLVRGFGEQIKRIDETARIPALALRNLLDTAVHQKFDPLPLALCLVASGLFGERIEEVEPLRRAASQARDQRDGGFAFLLSVGQFNTLNDAKAEADLPRRNALLDELRTLALAFPNDAAVREWLAKGLLNTLNHAEAEDDRPRRDALLDELRTLARAFPDDAAVRERLAKSLFNTLNHAKAEDDLPRRDALLDELRDLARAFPDDAAVREWLAKGLLNTLVDAKSEDDLPRRDALLDELRTLARTFPDDSTVGESLAKSLFNTLNDARADDDRPRRDALLDELRTLARALPDDAAVRERLARGLFNTLNHAKAEADLPRRDALLDELRDLARAFPDDEAVREQLAMGLLNTLNDAKSEDDLPRRDALLDELRTLARAFPDDAAVRERLAKSLFNTHVHAEAEDDRPRRDALLDELRTLARAFPDDAAARERLAKGLFNTHVHAEAEDDRPRCDALLDELRTLARTFPDDTFLQELLGQLEED